MLAPALWAVRGSIPRQGGSRHNGGHVGASLCGRVGSTPTQCQTDLRGMQAATNPAGAGQVGDAATQVGKFQRAHLEHDSRA